MSVFNITQFGAKADGSICTEAIQQALNACRQTGGMVVIPAGVYRSGTLELFSNTTLYLEAGAVLKGSEKMEDYPGFGYVHNELGEVHCLLHASDQENISILGEGKIDFNADAFFDYERPMIPDLDVESLSETQRKEFVVYFKERPNQMIFFRKCRRIRVKDVTLCNAACWGMVFSICENVNVAGVTIRFGIRLPNDDGIHIMGCKNVLIDNCDIVSGDDCIALSGIDAWTEENRNIIISNCLLSSSSAAIRLGYWNSHVKNCQINNCTVYDANRAVCIMACNGGLVENIQINGLLVETRSRVGGWWGMGEAVYIVGHKHDVHTVLTDHGEFDEGPRKVNIRNIIIRDLTAECENGIILAGDHYNIENIRFYNTTVKIKDSTNREYFGTRLDLAPGKTVKELPAGSVCWLYAEEIKDVSFEGVHVENGMEENQLEISEMISNCKNLNIR